MAKRVLLVEDEVNIVISLSFLLERAGFVVESEASGRVALASVLRSLPRS